MARIRACARCRHGHRPVVDAALLKLLFILPLLLPLHAVAQPDLVLNEVLGDPARDWDGSGEISSTEDEWVEIYNRGLATIDLDGYRLGDLDRNWAYGFSGTLPSEARITIYGSDSKAWQQTHGEPAFGLRLSNSGDTVVLWHIAGADTVMIDLFAYENHEADDDRSSGRRPDGAEQWELYDGLNAYGGSTPPPGNGCIPTPGASNNCVTPIEQASWGEVKVRHR